METCKTAPRQVLVINVGDELLDGLRENGHLLWLGEHLARRGLPVTRSVVVRDDAAEIGFTNGGKGLIPMRAMAWARPWRFPCTAPRRP